MNYQIEVSLDKNEEFSTFLSTKIMEFNNEHSIHHREVRKVGSRHPINIIVTNEQQQWVGGISAEVYWNWVEINDFWFGEEFRGKGLGSELLNKTEKLAIEKGAEKALLTTYDFQARSFYELKGYEVVGEIKDYPPGSSYFTMVKKLI
ncbi:GNAT family N-acetyltransferase [Viridibacillus sp. YIM B01967]|uniref:GNAT family N-acetyltransferase n=1 Tax=Viridibacillus soli TaxID=2798301 RepID=A0ABS1HAB2_9BACL|nr:GNAT family N-acetyltransferase [Viridibacillus soli]MBK3496370.1 GNAT family N-acetyltransferase [Viridibacillus soli]